MLAIAAGVAVWVAVRSRGHHERARDQIADMRHRAAGTIAGRVTGAASARVCAKHGEDLPHCTTSDGTFSLEVEPGAYVVWASAPNLRGGHVAVDVPEGGRTTIELTLTGDGAHVTGFVRDVYGTPIAGATVNVATTFTATTGRDGAFEAWVATGEVHAVASADGYVDGEASGIAPGELDFRLVPESGIAGVVIDAATKAPVADAEVEAGEKARTDASGHFRIGKLRPGRYKPAATSIGGYGEAAESVLVTLGKWREDIVIEIHPVAVVAGHLVTPAGPCPPDRGEVALTRYDNAAFYRAKTLVDGTIVLEGVVRGAYQVEAHCDGFLSRVPYADLAVADSDVEDVEWTVAAGARITGRVVAKDTGAPIADAQVRHVGGGGTSIVVGTTGPDGGYAVDGVAPGNNELTVLADGFMRGEATVAAALDHVAHVDVALDRGGTIVGDLVDPSGAPIEGGEVRVNGPESRNVNADASGVFTVEDLDPGAYDVEADFGWGIGRGTVKADVVVGQTSHVHVVATRDAGTIRGRVRDERGNPIADAYVAIAKEDEDGGGRWWHGEDVLPDASGEFRFDHLPPARFRLRAYRSGAGQAFAEHVDVGGDVELVIRPTGSIAGVVSGDGSDDITVHVEDKAHEVSRDERAFHTGGRFALRDLPAGTYKVWVGDDTRQAVVVVLAEGEQRGGVLLVAHRRYTLRGRLVGKDGVPLANYKVVVPHITSENATANGKVTVFDDEISITGVDGRFFIRNLPPGPATLSAGPTDAEGDPPAVRAVVLGDEADVDLGDVTP